MARPLRIEFDGALYHVISRGNERRPIAGDDGDRAKRLFWLQRTVETCDWHLHAFVLMNTHEHLFVETPEANLFGRYAIAKWQLYGRGLTCPLHTILV